jgi:HTH-type transcriptional regulator/antitoxin HigA
MTDIRQKGYRSPFAIHPGETIKEVLEFNNIDQSDLALRSGLSDMTISRILNGEQPVTLESSIKFERVLGLPHDALINLQNMYDKDKFRLQEEERLIKETKSLPKYKFYKDLVSLGYVKDTTNKIEKVKELLKFFGVNSLGSLKNVFPVAFTSVNFKHSNKSEISKESLAAWLRIGEIKAKDRLVPDFNKQKLIDNIPKMRALTKNDPKRYSQDLIELCAEAGVVLIYTPHLTKSCVNGAARWISPNKAIIQVSLYYRYADIFWFTLFHEIGHLLKHGKKESFIEFDSSNPGNNQEEEANVFAARVFIPVSKEEKFNVMKRNINKLNYAQKIQQFANDLDIDAGIIAGRIGREMNAWKYVSKFRYRLEFS